MKKISSLLLILGTFTVLRTSLDAACCSTPTPPFEKIYVSPCEILSTPSGIYYVTRYGEQIPVSAYSSDYYGNYVILITRQCKNCGKIYRGPVDCAEGTPCTFEN